VTKLFRTNILKKFYRTSKNIIEDSPTNNAGGGAVDGIGVGPRGEPPGKTAMMKLLQRLTRNKKKGRNNNV